MPSDLVTLLLAVLGISFLIFFHELGHFLAARAFGVRVETFSLGFGRRLVGWRRGDTDYRISLIPLGGYVKMAGEYGDPETGAHGTADDELFGKPAWQRLVIFSGGVLANFLLAFALFPIAFHMGVPFSAPVLGGVVEGGPAWEAGLREGDRVLTVGGQRVYDFTDIAHEVALADPGGVALRVRRPGVDEPFDVRLVPRRNEEIGMYDAGIVPATTRRIHVVEDGPADRAGLATGDRVVAVDGEPWDAWLEDYRFDDATPITVTYERDGVRDEVVVQPRLEADEDKRLMGVTACTTRVTGLRGNAEELPLREGDVVLAVAGEEVTTREALRERAAAGAGDLVLGVRRGATTLDVTIPGSKRDLLSEQVGFGPDFGSTRVRVLPGGALAGAGLEDGVTILAVDGQRLEDYEDLQAAAGGGARRLTVRYRDGRGGDERSVTIEPEPLETADIGFGVQPLMETHQETGMSGLRAGYDVSINFLRTTWLTLTKLFTGDVSTRNLGGIVSIGVITYHFAEWGLARLLFFLGLLSINLGFINLLPIPALDGGQMVFVLLEKIKGSRLSDRFLNGAQLTGFLMLLALIVYVTYNDIVRISG